MTEKPQSYYVAHPMVMRPAVDAIQEGNRLKDSDGGGVHFTGWACYLDVQKPGGAFVPHLVLVRFGDLIIDVTTRFPPGDTYHEVP